MDSGQRCAASACCASARLSATFESDSCTGAAGADDSRVRSAPASVTSRSTSVMVAASASWRRRARLFVSEAVLSSASGRVMPAVASESSETDGGFGVSAVPPLSPRTMSSTMRRRVTSSRRSRVNGSPGASRSSTPRLTASPRATHNHIHSTNSTRLSGGSGATSGSTITSAAGRPIADPSAPTTSTRLRNRPTNMNVTKNAMRSQAISMATIQTRTAAPRPSVAPARPRIEPSEVAAVSSCVMRYIMIITTRACGMRCVRTGIVAITQASVSRKVAPPRPGVGASSRRKNSTNAAPVTGSRVSASRARSRPPTHRCGTIRLDRRS
jgi:hypothetical protein